jgi:membrane protease YdiL (CAAX protease family)
MFKRRERLASAGIGSHNLWQACVIGLVLGALACCCQPTGLAAKLSNLSASGWFLLQCGRVGFCEEFLFRGYLQTRLIAWLGLWRGWVSASALMAVFHLPQYFLLDRMNPGEAILSMLGVLSISLFMGFVMIRTQNVVAPAIAHVFVDWAFSS